MKHFDSGQLLALALNPFTHVDGAGTKDVETLVQDGSLGADLTAE